MSGVLITRGMTVAIPAGGLTLSIGADGKSQASSVKVHVHYDVCPTWLELASRHLSEAKERKLARIAAWNSNDQDAKVATLEKEFESSMQAIMAAAIAMDSFYLALRDKANLPKDLIQTWREKRTARYKQVSEVFRRAFSLSPREGVAIRKTLKDVFNHRDLAVHPSGDLTAPVLHPELQTGVEWRFAVFRANNAEAVVRGTMSIIHELLGKGKPSTPEIQRYVEGLRNLIALPPGS